MYIEQYHYFDTKKQAPKTVSAPKTVLHFSKTRFVPASIFQASENHVSSASIAPFSRFFISLLLRRTQRQPSPNIYAMSMPYDDTDNDDIHTVNVRMHTDNDDKDFGNLETIDVLSTLSDESSITNVEADDPKQHGTRHRFLYTLRSMRRSGKETSGNNMKSRLLTRRRRHFQNISLRSNEAVINVKDEKEAWNPPARHKVDLKLQKTPTDSGDKSEMKSLCLHCLRRFGRTCNMKDTPLPPKPRRSRRNGSDGNNSLKR